MASVLREFKFALREKVVLVASLVAILLAASTVITGSIESRTEQKLIQRVKQLVDTDREYAVAKQSDPGGAAYYGFHFTYDPPSKLAFAARGVRDELPWKHRLRMLALEGQIYETDTGNPMLSKVGKLDFAFVAAFLMPLLLILLLYDLRASELRSNRWALLSATAGSGAKLLTMRAVMRAMLVYVCVIAPFLIAASHAGASPSNIALAVAAIGINVLFWLLLALIVIWKVESGPTSAALLLTAWFVVAVIIPVGSKTMVEKAIDVPRGGEILLSQREAVNDAWDLPKEETMTPFIERHPEWAGTPMISKTFEWRWYYAFQQVGDQSVEDRSQILSSSIAERDSLMGKVALLSPSLLTDRVLSNVAATGIKSFQRYQQCVRGFHAEIRRFHYPMLFGSEPFTKNYLEGLPKYTPCTG